jgi:hypothetical protein
MPWPTPMHWQLAASGGRYALCTMCITDAARQALKLRRGDAGWALVKAGSTRGHAFRIPPAR